MLSRMGQHTVWFVRQLVLQFVRGDCIGRAAALTYTTLFAVVPFMTVTYIILSTFSDLSEVAESVKAFIFSNFVPDSSQAVQAQLTQFSEQARGLTSFSLVFLFVTSFLMIVSIEKAFNNIWQVSEQRRGLQRFLLYWGVLTFGPPLIVGGLIVSSYLLYLPFIGGIDAYGIRESLLSYVPRASEIAAFTFLYYAVPNCQVLFKHALSGGVVAMLLFESAKVLFTVLVEGSTLETIYGAFAAVPLFLFWLYLAWVIILAGAIFVRTLSLPPDISGPQKPLLLQCLSVLQVLYLAHQNGESVSEQGLLERSQLDPRSRDRVMALLSKHKFVGLTKEQDFMLTRSLGKVRLWDLYLLIPCEVDEDKFFNDPLDCNLPGGLALQNFFQTGGKMLNDPLDVLMEKARDV